MRNTNIFIALKVSLLNKHPKNTYLLINCRPIYILILSICNTIIFDFYLCLFSQNFYIEAKIEVFTKNNIKNKSLSSYF